MDAEMKFKLRQLLIRHEDYRRFPYMDTVGKITIGIGRNLSDRPIEDNIITSMFENDIDYFSKFLSEKFDWFDKLNDERKIALIDMCFMGTQHFMTFDKMISALAKQDWQTAHNEIIDSVYAKEVGQRANDIATIILTGVMNG